ncbi:MAG TPA: hypothetical protein VMI73_11785 [Trebonia sp.]|nr:hypothetical protein [Trebonia sp.]
MIALLRYRAAILLRSHRWIFPLIAYGLLIAVGAAGSTSLAETLDWSGAMLVPVTAFLTRAMLTAEPDAARACVGAAAGPVRAQFATLLVPLGGGALLGGAAVVFGVLTAEPASGLASPPGSIADKVSDVAHHPGIVVAGLLIALICLLVGSAAGALCNPPMLRHPGAALLTTLAAVVLALAVDVSPAAAAIGGTKAQAASPLAATWPGAASLIGACCLLAAAWGVSVFAATRRDTWSVHSE